MGEIGLNGIKITDFVQILCSFCVPILWMDGRTDVLTFLTLTQVEPENTPVDSNRAHTVGTESHTVRGHTC